MELPNHHSPHHFSHPDFPDISGIEESSIEKQTYLPNPNPRPVHPDSDESFEIAHNQLAYPHHDYSFPSAQQQEHFTQAFLNTEMQEHSHHIIQEQPSKSNQGRDSTRGTPSNNTQQPGPSRPAQLNQLTNALPLQMPNRNPQGPSPLVRQLTEKVKSQAERLQVLEAYKALCEQRISELDPLHPLPVMPYHLGTPNESQYNQQGRDKLQSQASSAEVRRQLALKE
jgi:hypothetical protein